MDRQRFQWAQQMVQSRSFSLEAPDFKDSGPQHFRALCPFCDLFNHRPESPVTQAELALALDDDEVAPPSPWQVVGSNAQALLELRSPYGMEEGSQILLPYGIETNAELLACFGFSLGSQNEADYLEIFTSFQDLSDAVAASISDGTSESRAAQRASRLDRLESLDAALAPLALRPGDVDASAHLLGCLEFLLSSEVEAKAFREEYDHAVGHFTIQNADCHTARRLRRTALRVVSERVQSVLTAMATTLEEDRSLQGQLDFYVPAGARDKEAELGLQAALAYRIAVKEALVRWAAVPGV